MAIPAAAPFSKYMDENVLTPLISRLDFMLEEKHFVGSGSSGPPDDPDPSSHGSTSSSSSSSDGDFNIIIETMSQVQEQQLFGKTWEQEPSLVRRFDHVEKYIDGIFEAIAARRPQTSDVRERLGALRKRVVGIRDAILKAHTPPPPPPPPPQQAPTERMRMRAIRDRGEQAMAHLRRAVSAMDDPLRSCLLSLAAFPEGAVIKKRLLIHWWVGEKLVDEIRDGDSRLKDLADMDFVSDHTSSVHRCTVHPWIHRAVIVAAANSAAFMEVPDHDDDDISSNDYQRTVRACLRNGKATLPHGPGLHLHPKVQSIYNIDQRYVKLSADWLASKTCLRTLQLGQWRVSEKGREAADAKRFHVELIHDEHLRGVGACRGLRYLSLRGISGIKAVPDAVGNLSELRVLDLRACYNLQVLARGITKLHKLQYLDVSECYLLVEMPKGIKEMSELVVLWGFVMASSNRNKACRLSELVDLKNLNRLSVCIGRNVMKGIEDYYVDNNEAEGGKEDVMMKKAEVTENELNTLAALVQLKSLRITWALMTPKEGDDDAPPSSASKRKVQVRQDMKFSLPSGLVKLELQCFPYQEFGHLINTERLPDLRNLQKLYLTGGALNSLHHVGEDLFKVIKVLRLRCLRHLKNGEYDKLRAKYTDLEVIF